MGPLAINRSRAYTLVEMLVVTTIVTIAVGATVLAWRPDANQALAADAARLARQLELAHARARITGTSIAFSAEPNGYAFWTRDGGGFWRQTQPDDGLYGRMLDERVALDAVSSAGIPMASGQLMTISADDPAALVVILRGPHARAVVAPGPFEGRMDVRVERGP